mmetsp:Transcript_12625/g.28788  ORF Transcript_12625/g.28788 Transcript_12625/m.28788 type:complete len:256 (-) Transcript_12625:407-1174(-)
MGDGLAEGAQHARTSVPGVLHCDCDVVHLGFPVLLKSKRNQVTRTASVRLVWKSRPHAFHGVRHHWNRLLLGWIRCVLHLGLHLFAATVAERDGPSLNFCLQIHLLPIPTRVLLLGISVPVPQLAADTGQCFGPGQSVHRSHVPRARSRVFPHCAVRVLAMEDQHAECARHHHFGNYGRCGFQYHPVHRGPRQGRCGQHQGEPGDLHGVGVLLCFHDRGRYHCGQHCDESQGAQGPHRQPEGLSKTGQRLAGCLE